MGFMLYNVAWFLNGIFVEDCYYCCLWSSTSDQSGLMSSDAEIYCLMSRWSRTRVQTDNGDIQRCVITIHTAVNWRELGWPIHVVPDNKLYCRYKQSSGFNLSYIKSYLWSRSASQTMRWDLCQFSITGPDHRLISQYC